MQFPGYRQPGTVAESLITGVTVSDTRIVAQDGVVILGGSSTATEDLVTGGAVRVAVLERNRLVTARSGITIIGGVVTTSGTVTESRVEGVGGSGNVGASGRPAAVFSTDQIALSGAAPDSVQGNSVADVTVR